MITLADKMKVIQMHLTGYSSRKTIGKYVAGYEAAITSAAPTATVPSTPGCGGPASWRARSASAA